MDGNGNTYLDLNNKVQGKDTIAQSGLILAVTEVESDNLFETKGTELVPGLINNNYIGYQTSQHACNFASLDILNFINTYGIITKSGIKASEIEMSVIKYYPEQSKIDIEQIIEFSDGTSTLPVTTTI